MSLMFKGTKVFCSQCGSFELVTVSDELLGNIAGQEDLMVLKCESCGYACSRNFVETYEADFTDLKRRAEIIQRRIERYSRYKAMPVIDIAKPHRAKRIEEERMSKALTSYENK